MANRGLRAAQAVVQGQGLVAVQGDLPLVWHPSRPEALQKGSVIRVELVPGEEHTAMFTTARVDVNGLHITCANRTPLSQYQRSRMLRRCSERLGYTVSCSTRTSLPCMEPLRTVSMCTWRLSMPQVHPRALFSGFAYMPMLRTMDTLLDTSLTSRH